MITTDALRLLNEGSSIEGGILETLLDIRELLLFKMNANEVDFSSAPISEKEVQESMKDSVEEGTV